MLRETSQQEGMPQERLLQEASRQAAWPELPQGPAALCPAQVRDAQQVLLARLEEQQTEPAAHQPAAAWHPVHGAPRRRVRDVQDVPQQEASAPRVLLELHVAQAQPEEPRAARARVPVQLAVQHVGLAPQPEVQAALDAAARLRAPVAAVRRQGAPARAEAQAEQRQEEPRAEVLHVAAPEDAGQPVVRQRAGPPSVALSAEPWVHPWVLPCAHLQAQVGRPVPA